MQQDVDHFNVSNSEDPSAERFIVKKTELADVLYFYNLISSENACLQSFDTFFNKPDLEMLFEISYFSVTVIDHKAEDELIGIFIFNDSPFAGPRSEDYPLLRSQGLWEDWFHTFFDEKILNGRNTLWLVYFLLNENYALNEELQKRIYHKVHLSLYTTLNNFNHLLLLLPKKLENSIPTNLHNLNENEVAEKSAMICFKTLTSYMYFDLKEKKIEEESEEFSVSKLDLSKQSNKTNKFNVYLNSRISVFPTIEIRTGTQEDHDDLENIFKEQTPGEVMNSFYEDFFIAKMIAAQNEENKVLVGQVNDKAIGMLALGTNIDVNSLIKNFALEEYDNLLKQDYMNAVKLKKRKITSQKEKIIEDEKKELLLRYKREVMSCEKISQRIRLQEHIKTCETYIEFLEQIDKTYSNKEELNPAFASQFIKGILEKFEIKEPKFEPFENEIKINAGSCLLTDEFNFFIETLEFFGLPKGYMLGKGHWADYLQKEAERRLQREMIIKNLNKGHKDKAKGKHNKKENEQAKIPTHFDFSPLTKAMRLFKNASLRARSLLRKLVKENKNLIASFFVNEQGEPSETKCFDIMSLKKKLINSKINLPSEIADMIGPIFLCFGNLPYQKRTVMRVPEEEIIITDKIEVKKKTKTKTKAKQEEVVKKEVKPVEMILYEVSISDFFKCLETSFDYDKLAYELNLIDDETFKDEYQDFINNQEEIEKKLLEKEKSQFQKLKSELMSNNLEVSQQAYEKYTHLLENYENENDIPPTPPQVLNAFCVKLFFIEQAFESRSTDFLIQAFESFPDKAYMIITQPHSFFENSLLASFIKVDKKLDSLYGEVLYILHRESLMISLLKVDFAKEEDLIKSAYLFDNLPPQVAEENFILASESIRSRETSKFLVISAKVEESYIGIFLLSKEVNSTYYDSHFSIRDYSNLDKISKYLQGRILFFLSHKNFAQMTNLIMKEIMRLCNKISLYYEFLPNNGRNYDFYLKDLILLNNRRFPSFLIRKYAHSKDYYQDERIKSRTDGEERDEFDEKEAEFCLFMTTKKMLAEQRIANNNRIVVVGGSDTGISFIESLLSIRYLQFSYIFLISPGGLLYHHIEDELNNLKVSKNNYSIKQLQKLLLENRIKIINAKVTDIKPTSKYVQLEDKSIIPYDYLILTLGLQDRLHVELKNLAISEIEKHFEEWKRSIPPENIAKDIEIAKKTPTYSKMKEEFSKNVISIDDPYLYSKFSSNDVKLNSLRKNPKYEIILYGRSLNLLCFIQGLIKRGVKPQKIKLVIPTIYEHYPQSKDEKGKMKKEQNLEELIFINGNNLEDTKEVEDYLLDHIQQLGVTLLKNWSFVGVNIDETFDHLVSYRFLEDGTENTMNINACLILTGGLYDVDSIVFRFIHDNRLVYNGRAIVDKNFRTADKYIFAAGRLCEFSKAYTEKFKLMRLESYNSREVGITLAKSFLQSFESQLITDQSQMNENKIPNFFFSLPLGCYLPNDLLFFKIKSVKETNPYILEKGVNRQALIYNNLKPGGRGCYLKFTFNAFGIIDTITYLGDMKIDFHSIISLVGLHENYLNELLARYEVKLVEDIPAFLSEDWALALFHDGFAKLVLKLKAIIQDPEIETTIKRVVDNGLSLDRETLRNSIGNISETTKQKIELEVLSFLMENKNHLNYYYLPTK